MKTGYLAPLFAATLALGAMPAITHAQGTQYDPLTISDVVVGHGKIRMTVTAGSSGAPSGFTLWWSTAADYENFGSYWPATPAGWFDFASFEGVPTLNTFDGAYDSFQLGPNESIMIELGDLADETGVVANRLDELVYGTSYVFCGYANGGGGSGRSPLTVTLGAATSGGGTQNCTFTQGYWKTHGAGDCHNGNNADVWPVASLTLGTVNYTAAELCAILNQSTGGNGLVSMAHQLIATKLNIANGADGSSIAATIAAADAQIGALVIPPIGAGFLAPASTSSKTQALDDFNNGITGPGHCPPTGVNASSWGRVKTLYR
jgi:hypothetical protein